MLSIESDGISSESLVFRLYPKHNESAHFLRRNWPEVTKNEQFSTSFESNVDFYIVLGTIRNEERVINFMVKNNIEVDIKVKILEGGYTQERLGTKIGTTSQYVNRIIKKKEGLLNKTFIQMIEALGYDIELVYVPCEKRDA